LPEDEQTSKHGGGGRYNAILEFKRWSKQNFLLKKKKNEKEKEIKRNKEKSICIRKRKRKSEYVEIK
jgi:hypothetical protein